jgi:hypothetical protein
MDTNQSKANSNTMSATKKTPIRGFAHRGKCSGRGGIIANKNKIYKSPELVVDSDDDMEVDVRNTDQINQVYSLTILFCCWSLITLNL